MAKKMASDTSFEPQSPDELDRYIKVTRPGVWMVLALCLVVLAAALAWAMLGRVNTTVNGCAACVPDPSGDGVAVCMFVTSDELKKLSVGNTAVVDGVELEVGMVSELPMSREEETVMQLIPSEYLRDEMFEREWGYYVRFAKPGSAETVNKLLSLSVSGTASDEDMEAINACIDLKEYGFVEMEPLSATIVTRSIVPISLVFG